MKLFALVLSLGIYAQAQTAQHLMGGSPNVTPGCVVSVPGDWNDTEIWAANIFLPGNELGGFAVSVNGVACAIHQVGPERLVFWMPVDAPLGDYSAIVNTPTGIISVAMHVVEAAPTIHASPNGVAGIYSPIAFPSIRSIGPDGVINLPQDGSSVLVTLFASGLNPAANLVREMIFIRESDHVETRFPVLGSGPPGGVHMTEALYFILGPIPAGDYQIVSRVGAEFSEPEDLTIRSSDACVDSISPAVTNFSAKGGTSSLSLTAGANCEWNVVNSIPWVSITGASGGTGNGTITFEVNSNSGINRAGSMDVGGQTFRVRQGANFLDVPQDSVFYEFIGKVSATGITIGCNPGGTLFCANQIVTREQMAAFIVRALGEFNPPPPVQQRFADVPPTSVFYSFIDQLAERRITVGCNFQGTTFCPGQAVTREQMSAFMIRALGEFNPPNPALQRFVDVPPANPFFAFIDQMAVRTITLGCNPLGTAYCPTSAVTREQMAAFLVRAFGL